MSISAKMGKQIMLYSQMKYWRAKQNELPLYTLMWVNLKMLSEKESQGSKAYRVIHLHKVQNQEKSNNKHCVGIWAY